MKIAIGNDHAGPELKKALKEYIEDKYHYEVINFGTDTLDSVNYPEYGEKVGEAVVSGIADRGIVICGTGIGISIAANKVNGVRCALCNQLGLATLAVEHNNANVLAMGARIIDLDLAKMIVDEYFAASFTGGRHQTRIDLIRKIEEKQKA